MSEINNFRVRIINLCKCYLLFHIIFSKPEVLRQSKLNENIKKGHVLPITLPLTVMFSKDIDA